MKFCGSGSGMAVAVFMLLNKVYIYIQKKLFKVVFKLKETVICLFSLFFLCSSLSSNI